MSCEKDAQQMEFISSLIMNKKVKINETEWQIELIDKIIS